ncbi:MAG: hypothetical protein Q9187_004076 [Circinaria calcarea]
MAQDNLFLLAADNNPNLLRLLRSNPALASSQDEHGYSLMHAAASYNHNDLLRTLVSEFHVDVNIKDEDGETALFVVETVEAAQTLLDELRIDATVTNEEGMTAEEKIRAEGDYPTIAEYLRESRMREPATNVSGERQAEIGVAASVNRVSHHPPPLPPNVTVNVATMDATMPESQGEEAVDPEFRRRIEELAAREDFQGEQGQNELRELIKDAVRGVGTDERRDVRRRLD